MCKLAVIDDNPLDHFIIQKILDDQRIFPDRLHLLNAKVLVDMLSKTPVNTSEIPDVILLDLNMPDCSGWDVLKAISINYPVFSKPIDIYILSSSIDVHDKTMSKSFPFVKDFLVKPIQKQALKVIHDAHAA